MKLASESQNPTQSLCVSEQGYRLLVEAVADYAIILLDPQGVVSSWNKGAENIKGYAPQEIVGHYFSCFYPQESVALGWPEHELLIARVEGRFEDEGWRVRKDGSRFWASISITALYDEDGKLWGYSNITRDLTERRIYEESLRQSEERFRLLVDGVKDCAIFLLNPEGIVSSWNAGAEKITGYKAEDIVGEDFAQLYPQESVEREWPRYELEVAQAEGSFEDEGWRVRKDRSRFWANVLVTALHDAEDQLYGFAIVTRDLTEQKRIEALELAEQRMNEFLAMLSHELRNPLAPMRSALSVMQIAPLDDPVQAQSRAVIERQVTNIARLVDDLLDVSRVTAGTIKLRKEPVDLFDVIASAVESSLPLITDRGHRLEQYLPDERVVVEGDLMRLTQVIINLLNNAAQYTPEGGRVRVRVEASVETARIRVQDTGEGIPRQMLAEVFSLFVQGERSLDRSDGGLGIGLTLARRLVEMQGGTICATSDGPGLGSEFVVELPLLQVRSEATEASSVVESDERSKPVRGRRILLVEDMPDVAEGMEMILKFWGHEVHVVHDGQEALKLIHEVRPEVVLLDIGLPGMSGYEVAKKLREIPELQPMTLIALTGYGQQKDKKEAFAAGFDHHLVKGDSLDALQVLLCEAGR
jgi:PAS domain S-box-containing protein